MTMDLMEVGARLTLLGAVLEHMLARDYSARGEGQEALEALKTSVLRSITEHRQFDRPVSQAVKDEHLVNVRTLAESFFGRAEEFRTRLVSARERRS